MAQEKVQIRSVLGQSSTIIIEREYLVIWLRNTADRVSPAIITILVLIDIIAKMNNVVNGVFSCRISVRIEESKWQVTARVDG